MKKKQYLIFALVLILIPIIVAMFRPVLKTEKQKQQKQDINTLPPTLIPTETPSGPSIGPTQTKGQEKLMNNFQNRTALSQQDAQAKQRIISQLPQNSETIYESSTFKVDYVQSADLLQVEILTTDVATAKTQATTWFQSQGMSKQGMCLAPVQFYLNFDIKQQLQEQNPNFDFNPIPEGC